jgi:cellulose synthase operon protein YhjQ
MNTIALVSLKGGTGRSAVAAHLGAVLAARQRVVLFDADPQNGLGHYFGMVPGERFGLSQRRVAAADLIDFVRRTRPEVAYLPFGTIPEEDLSAIEEELAADPNWLRGRIEDLARADFDLALIDAPAGNNVWSRQALAAADQIIVVVRADPASYATVPATRAWLDHNPTFDRSGTYWLVNGMDARSQLSRDVRSALSNLLPDELLPIAIPNDEGMREALGHQQSLVRRFPDSQVLASLRDLAGFLSERLTVADEDEAVEEVKVVPLR